MTMTDVKVKEGGRRRGNRIHNTTTTKTEPLSQRKEGKGTTAKEEYQNSHIA